jgi:ATP-dependent DNA helicase RecG
MPERPSDPVAALLAPARPLKGVRKDVAELIVKVAGGPLARDLAFLAPHSAIDRRNRVAIADARPGEIATIEAEVDAHIPAFRNAPYRVRLRDETGFLSAAYFRAKPDMLQRLWPIGQKRLISGKVDIYDKTGERQMLHPDHVVDPAKGEAPPPIEPVYPLTANLPGRTLARAVQGALDLVDDLPEWLEASTVAAHGWPSFRDALTRLHRPEALEDIEPKGAPRTRLAYDELFARQCALRLRRAVRGQSPGRVVSGDGRLQRAIVATLPYALTGAQERATREICADMETPAPMLRLLQGDVGAGKTLVAALAMARAAEAGLQSALMAPTDILARQHARTLAPLLDAAAIRWSVLSGRDKGKARDEILERMANGELGVVIGTHALFQDDVAFADLALIVIDEQHRFGVSDRMRLVSKGANPHVLVMSATPIPRTLALAVHGDMDISVLDEKPPGRQPIATRAIPDSRIEEVAEAIAEAAKRGERAYWVCPLIEQSEAVDLAAVEDRYHALKARFGDGVEIMHGRLTPAQREAAMDRFRAGAAFVLVATTVIEVGVDVPKASIMVIEQAERFGLAQLHQLRGRVGRGGLRGSCVLLWRAPLGDTARARLDALRRNDDGFAIAEIDYTMRGAGDVLGVQQSGLPPFRLVDPETHGPMLMAADQEARLAITRDPELKTARGHAVAMALRLFGYEEAAALARSG